jgi:ABC-type taurine transport system substrate-binding protein
MIVRILGEGQRTVDDGELETLNALDNDLIAACEAGDADGFTRSLAALLDKVREVGKVLPDEEIVPSDLVLPSSDASLDEVRELLGDEGLIPG